MQATKILTRYNFTDANNVGRIRYLVIHYFGGLSGAENLAKYWAGKYVGASAHYAVGHAGEIFQCVEDADIAWHCGASKYVHKSCRNSNSLGIEMAVRKKKTATMNATDKDWYFEPATFEAAVALTVEKMKQYGIPPENVLRHKDVTGKICPNPMVLDESLWAEFKRRITAGYRGAAETPAKQPEQPEKQPEQQPDMNAAPEDHLYMVETTAAVLNIRKGPGTKYGIAGTIAEPAGQKKKYRITEEQDGWGRLYSGAGWISLNYTRRVG